MAHIVAEGQLNTNDETNLNNFLTNETTPFLTHVTQLEPKTQEVINGYLQIIHEQRGMHLAIKRSGNFYANA